MLTSTEVAERLGVSRQYVGRLVKADKLKGFRHGRVLRFHEPDVDELVKTGMVGGTSERHREAARQRRVGA